MLASRTLGWSSMVALTAVFPVTLSASSPLPEVQAAADSPADSADARRRAERALYLYRDRVWRAVDGPESDVLVRQPSFGLMPPERQRALHLDEATLRRPGVIETLDEVAAEIPGDDWVTGYRVALRIKQGWLGEAIDVAEDCAGTTWWCEALRAWAFHTDGRAVEAERSVDAAVAAMPNDRRCQWSESLLEIVSGALDEELGTCDQRATKVERLWWLADPLHLRAGNERKVEHFVRVLAMEFHHEYLSFRRGRCEPSHHARILRGGWPSWWFALPVALDPVPSGQSFLPPDDVWSDPLEAREGAWDLAVRRHGERYAFSTGPIQPLDQQTAFLRRSDSTLVAVSTRLAKSVLVAGAALSTSESAPQIELSVTDTGGPVRVRRSVVGERFLVSVEAITPGGGAYRARFGHGLPEAGSGGLAMSDLVLFDWRDDLDHEFESVFPLMLGTRQVPRHAALGIYWETYGLDPGESVEVRMQLRRIEVGFFRRIGEVLRLVDAEAPVTVRWTVPDQTQVGRHLRLDLASQEPGEFELLIEVRTGEDRRAAAARTIDIIDA